MTVSSHTLAYTRAHTATHLTGVILGAIGDILADLGISCSRFTREWQQNENAIQAWITEGSLEMVVPPRPVPRQARPGSGRHQLPAVLHVFRPAHAAAGLGPWEPIEHRGTPGHHVRSPRPRPERLGRHALPLPLKDTTMGYVDDAFAGLRHNLEITQTERDTAVRRHHAIRDFVRSRWNLEDDFLTGSYRRDTKTKKLKDIDIFAVIDPGGPQGGYRGQPPGKVLQALEDLLRERWPDASRDGMAVVIHYGKDDDVMSVDVVPAFDRNGGGYVVPDPGAGRWIATNPKIHHELSTAKNTECDGKFVPFVKMVKGINRELGELGEPVSPSFLLEVMAQSLVKAPFGRYQDETALFLATAADQLGREWPDPAGLGGDVNTVMGPAQKVAAAAALHGARLTAERAIDLEDDGQERAAYDEWKKLFGNRITRP
jgi:hypothetical protein